MFVPSKHQTLATCLINRGLSYREGREKERDYIESRMRYIYKVRERERESRGMYRERGRERESREREREKVDRGKGREKVETFLGRERYMKRWEREVQMEKEPRCIGRYIAKGEKVFIKRGKGGLERGGIERK